MAEIVVSIPPGARCEETSDSTVCAACYNITYLRCGSPASMVVWHAKDRRAYFMCSPCGSHNVRNRGGVDVTDHTRRSPRTMCSKHLHIYVNTCKECNNVFS